MTAAADGVENNLVRDDPSVTELVARARKGDQQAWDAIVERYAPLIWSICRRFRLGAADTEDVGQAVWLHLVGRLDDLREPAALPGWLATTARRECLRVHKTSGKLPMLQQMLNAENLPDERTATSEDELLVAERSAALREALSHLSPSCQQLMAMLLADPPAPYAEISARLGISIGSIGPYRARCLDKLRRDPAIAALIDAEAAASC